MFYLTPQKLPVYQCKQRKGLIKKRRKKYAIFAYSGGRNKRRQTLAYLRQNRQIRRTKYFRRRFSFPRAFQAIHYLSVALSFIKYSYLHHPNWFNDSLTHFMRHKTAFTPPKNTVFQAFKSAERGWQERLCIYNVRIKLVGGSLKAPTV